MISGFTLHYVAPDSPHRWLRESPHPNAPDRDAPGCASPGSIPNTVTIILSETRTEMQNTASNAAVSERKPIMLMVSVFRIRWENICLRRFKPFNLVQTFSHTSVKAWNFFAKYFQPDER